MPTLEALIGGQTYNLSDGMPFAWIAADEGMAPVRRLTERGPQQHGDTDQGFLLDPTEFPMGFRLYATSMADQWTARQLALRIFRPSRVPIQLRWTLETGDVRQADVHVQGKVLFASKDSQGFTLRFVVPLRAADPTLYDPVMQSVVYGVGAGNAGWIYPLAFPRAFGSNTVNQTRAIPYAGTWKSFPVVIIKGPVTNPVITNLTTGDKLDLTGTTISAGQTYTIDCRPGVKSIVDQAGVNRINTLSDDSDLTTFALEADPEAPGGINTIRVIGSVANATTDVYLQWYTRYIGL